ncbi:hypothetical protein PCH70_27260 [Pseudomonas cichorii JBC1]|nr:hypothetical protein PCH70_27260 [Pseudomonas cichorii JBC1]
MLDFISDALNIFANWPTYERPRRVFTRGFVIFCIVTAVAELLILNELFGS